MFKHAYLIRKHSNLPVAQAAIRLIDNTRDSSKRMIEWNKEHWAPIVFTEKDFDGVSANKNCFFVRKVYANIDMKIVNLLEQYLTEKKAL
jgi:hypothetical protein